MCIWNIKWELSWSQVFTDTPVRARIQAVDLYSGISALHSPALLWWRCCPIHRYWEISGLENLEQPCVHVVFPLGGRSTTASNLRMRKLIKGCRKPAWKWSSRQCVGFDLWPLGRGGALYFEIVDAGVFWCAIISTCFSVLMLWVRCLFIRT